MSGVHTDSDPEEYPAALLKPSVRATKFLRRIYALIVRTLSSTDYDCKRRDTEIYRRHQQGESTAELATAYGLSAKHICHNIRVAPQEEANHE